MAETSEWRRRREKKNVAAIEIERVVYNKWMEENPKGFGEMPTH